MRRLISVRIPDRDDDRGRVVLLIAGLFGILSLLIVGGVDVTAIQLARMHVLDASDAAAADAADAADPASIYGGGVGSRLVLSDALVRSTAGRSLAGQELPDHVTGWRIDGGTGAQDKDTAVVQVTAVVHPPILGGPLSGIFGDVHVTVQSRARANVR